MYIFLDRKMIIIYNLSDKYKSIFIDSEIKKPSFQTRNNFDIEVIKKDL
jgi:hypothetical protein